jgi:hypothetical protein
VSDRTPANLKKIAQLQKAEAELLERALRRGFYGEVDVKFAVQDGTIQEIRCTLTQVER